MRYRGYYYDTETGFYYLQSRYYDPVLGRFINADSYASTGQGFLGYNMFAYCANSPICTADFDGRFVVVIIYDNNEKRDGEENYHNKRFAQRLFNIAGLSEENTAVLIPVNSTSDYISRWNELSETHIDVLVIAVHGNPGNIEINNETIGANSSDTHQYDELKDLNVNLHVLLLSCYGGTDCNTGNTASHLANKTHAPVIASTSKVYLFTPLGYAEYFIEKNGLWITALPLCKNPSKGMNRSVVQ